MAVRWKKVGVGLAEAAAVCVALGVWLTREPQLATPPGSTSPPSQESREGASAELPRPGLASEPGRPTAVAPDAAPDVASSRAKSYGLSPALLSAVERYRGTDNVAEREDSILELALSDEPAVLSFLMDELQSSDPNTLPLVLEGLMQYGSREPIPELHRRAARAATAEERKTLTDTADFLELPSLTELRRGEAKNNAEP